MDRRAVSVAGDFARGPRIALLALLAWGQMLAALPVAAAAGGAPSVPPLTPRGSEDLVWRDDPDLSAVVPPAGDRPVLLYFTAIWCGPCKLIEREVFHHLDGRGELRHYDLVRLDLDSAAGREVADSRGVRSVPTFVMLDAQGREIERLSGYRSRRLLLRDLARFRAGAGTLGDLRRRLAAAPDDPLLQLEVGLRHHDRNEAVAARDVLAAGLAALAAPGVRAARDDTLIAAATRALAENQRRLGETDAAARVLEDLLAARPAHPFRRVTWQMLAACRRDLGDDVAAVQALREAAAVAPPRAEALGEFALAAAAAGWQLEAAEAAARQAVALTGRADPQAMATLAAVLRSRGNFPEAMLWIKRAEAAAPGDERWPAQRRAILQAAIDGR